MHSNLKRVAGKFCWVASFACASRYKRVGRYFFTSAVMALSLDERASIEPTGRMPASI
jgi:hypothetical protein